MTISYSTEKLVRLKGGVTQMQEIIFNAEANSEDEADDLTADDFSADLYINNKFVADISYVIPSLEFINSIDWREIYCDQKSEPVRFEEELQEVS